jgi:nitroreductase
MIITAFEKTRSGFTREGVAENEVGEGWGCYDLGLQNENLVLKAKDMGLDTLIMGIRNSEKLREYLEIPASQEVVSVIAVGYGAIKPEMPVRKNVEDIVKFF